MLEEKLELLTKETVALRKAVEANTAALGGTAAPAAEKAPAAAAKKTPAKKPAAKVVEPEHDADEVGAIFRKAAKIDKPAARKHLKSVGAEDLADLLTKPELYDAAFEAAEAIIDAEGDTDDDDDEV
jgi:hypothetical protein